jgi:hypothetical protein
VMPDQLGDVPLVLGDENTRRPRSPVLDTAPYPRRRFALAVVSHAPSVAPRRYGAMTKQ